MAVLISFSFTISILRSSILILMKSEIPRRNFRHYITYSDKREESQNPEAYLMTKNPNKCKTYQQMQHKILYRDLPLEAVHDLITATGVIMGIYHEYFTRKRSIDISESAPYEQPAIFRYSKYLMDGLYKELIRRKVYQPTNMSELSHGI